MRKAWFETATRELAETMETAAAGRLDNLRTLGQSDLRVSNWTLACEHLQLDRWLQPEKKAA